MDFDIDVIKMRIAIDCRWIFPKLSGIGRYTDNLMKGLTKVDRSNTYLFLKEPLVPYGLFSLANQIRLPRLLRRLDVDIYHSTNFMIPLFMGRRIKVVITIHDLIPWKFPQYTPKAKKTRFNWLFRWVMKRAVKRADRIIAVSENTKRDICECLMVSPSKISVVYNGIGSEFFVDRQVEKEGYILFVGRADPYKNLMGLIEAYKILLDRYKISNKLLVVGEEDPRYPRPGGLGDKIIYYGYADPKELVDIYCKASVLVMPSLYEGFGLPAIEAMACGVPVVVSNTPALVEIVKDYAYVATTNLADCIYRALMEGPKVGAREYARQFTIEKMAEETLRVYKSLQPHITYT